MTKQERAAIRAAAKRLQELASLERAAFAMTEEKDKAIKDGIRPYMIWFDVVAMHLEDLAVADNKYSLENAIDALLNDY